MRSALRLSVRYSMNFWRKGVGLEYMLFIARSLELLALPYALNRPPRAAASFNKSVQATAAARFRFLALVVFIPSFCRARSLSAAVPDLWRSMQAASDV